MSQNSSNVSFWAKHIGLAAVLIIVAAVLISVQHLVSNRPTPDGEEKNTDPAAGLSEFYTSYHQSSTKPIEEEKSDFVMEVKRSDVDINKRLQSMESIQKPVKGRWTGEYKSRPFKAGSTLREAITNYAQSEGMQVIWELDQDFIVKDQFMIDNTVVGALEQIASAVDSNFENEVRTFFCAKQRSLIITDEVTDYITANCIATKG